MEKGIHDLLKCFTLSRRAKGPVECWRQARIMIDKESTLKVNKGPFIIAYKENLKSKEETRLMLRGNAKLSVDGRWNVGAGSDIRVFENGELIVTYQDGFRAKYDGITPEQVADFVKAPSKGRWAHQHLWKLPYQAV